ncbi:uncharacterized protein TM35_000061840 [Trypanosoma theileri]|uniref:RRM domain-containing protein n=1 Tax=Trypanosoma theileri TaxID=67003 RepID=A0A1X0P3P7_9TRYP|nr:uncharacterized protein TM35_000061840 [Trypanosoma theileri]ORC91179.1 hypothetical protein TM35_000061840 [Trypanosoma theileri]
MPMAQQQQQQQQPQKQQQQQQQHQQLNPQQQLQTQQQEQLNPQAPVWIPRVVTPMTMPTTVFPPFYPFPPPAMSSPYMGLGPVPPSVRPIAGYSLFSHGQGTGSPFPSPGQHAWIDAKRNYFSSFPNLYMTQQPPYGTDRGSYLDVPPPTLPFFPSGPFASTKSIVAGSLIPTSDKSGQDVMCRNILSTEKREEDVPQEVCRVEKKMDVTSIEDWHRYLSESCSSCLLCGEDGHRYSACRLFDGKSVCFLHISTSCVYVMHHMQWIEGAKLRDVYSFIHSAMGLSPDQVVLFVSNQMITFTNYSLDTRCCDLHLLPGAIVGVTQQKLSIEERLPLSVRQGMSPIRRSVREVLPIEEKETHIDATFDVSTIAKSSELSVSTAIPEGRTQYPLESTMEEITEVVSLTHRGDSAKSGIASTRNEEEEKSPMSVGGGTAVPSPQTSKSGTLYSESRDPTLTTVSSLTSAIPFSDVTTGITFRGDSGPLNWPEAPGDDKGYGMEERTHRIDPTMTTLAGKDAVLSPSTTEDAASEELRRRRTVHVKFIPVTMTFSAIRALLWSCGEVNKVRLVRPRTTAHPERTFYVCFAEYADEEGAARMIALHGCRVAGNFTLAVAPSRDAIRGGFITDRDFGSGRPCTFGLNEVEMRRLGIPTTTPMAVPTTTTTTTTTTPTMVIPSARETVPLPPFAPFPKRFFPTPTTQEKRGKVSVRSNIEHKDDSSSEGEEGEERGSGGDDESGPYTLQIVSTVKGRKGQQRDPSRRVSGIEGSENVLSASPRTLPAMRPFPEVASRETIRRAETLRASLRDAVLNHLNQRSSESFYNAFRILEELRWTAGTALFHLELAVFEVLLLLNQDNVILSKDLEKSAAAAVRLGTELHQILQSVAANNSAIAPMWRSLFTPTPPVQQREQEYGVVESEIEGGKLHDSPGVSPIYPCLSNCLRFVELLLYIAVLLDSSHKKKTPRRDEAETTGATLSLPLPPQTNPLHDVESELLVSARRLLMQLQLEFSTERGVSASAKCTWGDKISSILQRIPSTSGWHDGNLIHLLSTNPRQSSQGILLESLDFRLF